MVDGSASGEAAIAGHPLQAALSRGHQRSFARPTLDSVAQRAGVSKQTVSNVLNTPSMVRPDTADRVRSAISELGYRPHLAAKQLRTRQSRLLGLRVVRNRGDAVFDRFLHALTDAASRLDYRIMLYTADTDEDEIAAYDELLGRWDVDGFVLTSTHPGDRRTEYLSTKGVPCVTFGRPWDGSDHHPWVDVDGCAGTEAATKHLIEAGHRRIGFLGWSPSSGVGDDRELGWRSAMSAAGLDAGPVGRSTNDLQLSREAAGKMLDQQDISALVCVSDVMAAGAMAAATARPSRSETKFAVVGFDNSELAVVMDLTTIEQPLAAVADHCVRMVIDRVRDDRGMTAVEQVLLTPTLITRGSSG